MMSRDDIFAPDSRRRVALQADLVPLINIVFLLLIFFLVTGTALSPSDDLETPTAFSGVQVQADAIDVRLRADKKLEIDGVLMTVTQVKDISRFFADAFAKNPKRQVLLSADAHLSAKYLLQLIQLVSSAGGQNISIATQMVETNARK